MPAHADPPRARCAAERGTNPVSSITLAVISRCGSVSVQSRITSAVTAACS